MVLLLLALFAGALSASANPGSVYTLRPDDPQAYYFTPDSYDVVADGTHDVSDALQQAIN